MKKTCQRKGGSVPKSKLPSARKTVLGVATVAAAGIASTASAITCPITTSISLSASDSNSATCDVSSTGTLQFDSTLTFTNTGTLTNEGVISVDGTLINSNMLTTSGLFSGAGSLNNSGTFTVAGGTASIAASTNLSSGALTGGSWVVSGGTLSIGTGAISSLAAGTTVSLQGPGTFSQLESNLTSNAGTLNILGGKTFAQSKSLANSGTLDVQAGGVFANTGSLNSTGSLAIETGAKLKNTGTLTSSVTFTNAGTLLVLDGGTAAITHSTNLTGTGGVAYTLAGGVWVVSSQSAPATLTFGDGTTAISTLGAGTTVELDGNQATFSQLEAGGLTTNNGTIILGSGHTLNVASGQALNNGSGASIQVGRGATLSAVGTLSGAGEVNLTQGSLNVGPGGQVTIGSSQNLVSDGGAGYKLTGNSSWNIDSGPGTAMASLAFGNGTAAITTIDSGTSVRIAGQNGSFAQLEGSLTNNLGSLTIGSGHATSLGSATLTNASGAQLLIEKNASITTVAGQTLTNNGVINVGTGTSNPGGTLTLNGDLGGTGTLNNFGTVDVSGSNAVIAQSGSFGGRALQYGNWVIDGSSKAASLTIQPGYTLDTIGAGASVTLIGRDATFAQLENGLVSNQGTLTIGNGATWGPTQGITNQVGATLNVSAGGGLGFNSPARSSNAGTLNNAGIVAVNTPDWLVSTGTINNSGEFGISGTLQIDGGGTLTGSGQFDNNGTLTITNGSVNVSHSSNLGLTPGSGYTLDRGQWLLGGSAVSGSSASLKMGDAVTAISTLGSNAYVFLGSGSSFAQLENGIARNNGTIVIEGRSWSPTQAFSNGGALSLRQGFISIANSTDLHNGVLGGGGTWSLTGSANDSTAASLVLNGGAAITALGAGTTVQITGSNAFFNQLSSLANLNGTLSLAGYSQTDGANYRTSSAGLTIGAGGMLAINQFGAVQSNSALNNIGTIAIQAGGRLQSGGTLTSTGNFTNAGVFTLTGGTASITGSANLVSNSAGGYTLTGGGVWNLNGGSLSLNSGSAAINTIDTGTTVNMNGGSFTQLQNSLTTVAGTLTVGGSSTFAPSNVITVASGGTFGVTGGANVTLSTTNLSAGEITAGNWTVSSGDAGGAALTLRTSTGQVGAVTQIGPNATVTLSGASASFSQLESNLAAISGSLNIQNGKQFSAGQSVFNAGVLTVQNGASVSLGNSQNLSSGTLAGGAWDVSSVAYNTDGSRAADQTTSLVLNGGAAIKSLGQNTSVTLSGAGAQFSQLTSNLTTNYGSITADQGYVYTVGANGLKNIGTLAGSISVAGSGALTNSGTIAATSFSNAGSVSNSGTITATSVNNTGTLSGGTLNASQVLNSGFMNITTSNFDTSSSTLTGGSWYLQGGSVNLGSPGIRQIGSNASVYLQGGTMRGSNQLVSNSGFIENEASTQIGGGTVGSIGANNFINSGSITNRGTLTSTRSFTNSGTIQNDGALSNSGTFVIGGSLNNSQFATLTTTAAGSTTVAKGGTVTNSGAVTNAGTLTVQAGGVISSTPASGAVGPTASVTNTGTVDIQAGGAITGHGNYTQSSGTTTIDGILSANVTQNGGTINGNGVLDGNLILNGGMLAPGHSPGTLEITGNLDVAGGILQMQIGGTTPGSYDVIKVDGAASFASSGVLQLDFLNGFAPTQGSTYQLFELTAGAQPVNDLQLEVIGLKSSAGLSLVDNNGVISLAVAADGVPAPVPLPNSGGLLLAGGLGVWALSRRRPWTTAPLRFA